MKLGELGWACVAKKKHRTIISYKVGATKRWCKKLEHLWFMIRLNGVYKPTYNLGAPHCTTYTTDLLKPKQGGFVTEIQTGWILGVDAQIER